jgi:hypothetical protein
MCLEQSKLKVRASSGRGYVGAARPNPLVSHIGADEYTGQPKTRVTRQLDQFSMSSESNVAVRLSGNPIGKSLPTHQSIGELPRVMNGCNQAGHMLESCPHSPV